MASLFVRLEIFPGRAAGAFFLVEVGAAVRTEAFAVPSTEAAEVSEGGVLPYIVGYIDF